jgi:carboxymethylenebutenolidase
MSPLLVLVLMLAGSLPALAVEGHASSSVAVEAGADCHPATLMAAATSPTLMATKPANTPAPPDTSRRRRTRLTAYPDTAMIRLGTAENGTDAFVAYPPGSGAAPAIVLVHEWWGLNGQIREMARRLAQQGYVTIVPDLYHGHVASDPENAHILMRGLDEDRAVDDLKSARDWLRGEPRTAKSRTGTMGFCMGGHLAELLAFGDPSLSAAVIFYGSPESRRERVLDLRAPILGHYGAEDQGIDTSRVEAFRQMLVGSGKTAEIYVYPGAGHAFMNEEQPSYRPEAARLAWVRTLAFLQKYLKGSS